MERYKGIKRHEVPPHVFAITDTAYRSMLQGNCNFSKKTTLPTDNITYKHVLIFESTLPTEKITYKTCTSHLNLFYRLRNITSIIVCKSKKKLCKSAIINELNCETSFLINEILKDCILFIFNYLIDRICFIDRD